MADDYLFALPDAPVSQPVPEAQAPARCQVPQRNQVEIIAQALDALLPADHRARIVWAFVERQDLSALYAKIRARQDRPGRDPIPPDVLLGLWLQATLDGIGSARELARRCETDLPYMWLCGGISVNYHTLSDFRTEEVAALDELLTRNVAALIAEGLVALDEIAQDGMRVRASAGSSSYRRRPSLEKAYAAAKQRVEDLKAQGAEELSARQRAAQERAAREREERVGEALKAMERLEQQNAKQPPSRRKDPQKVRVSTTDPDIPVMKMPGGGFRPAVNVEFATATQSQIITGADVVPLVDQGQMLPMLDQHKERYGEYPDAILIDGGFCTHEDLDAAAGAEIDCTVYSPPTSTVRGQDPYAVKATDSPPVAAWRERMATPEAKETYKRRASTAECVNALARNRDLYSVNVRGLTKIRAAILWYVLAHNLMREHSLRQQRMRA